MLPPRRVRRVTGPLLLAALTAGVLLLPVLVVVAVVVSVWLPGRWRGLRLLAFALAYVAMEVAALGAAAVLWVRFGGRRWRGPAARAAHYTVLRVLLDALMRLAQRLFALRLVTDGDSWSPLDDGIPGSTNAMVVLSRHAGPGDSLLLVHTLMNRDHLRQPRVVLKDVLQLDPLIDVYLNRLPNHFVSSDPATAGQGSEEAIAALARDLGEEDALLIFPEGANFTPGRRTRAIQRLRERGLLSAMRRAEAMPHVLPPRPGGVVAALDAAPHADVVFVAHTGLEHLSTVRDVWRGLPMDKTLHLRWWFVPAAEVPREEAQLTDWLYRWWETIDAWIAATSAATSAEERREARVSPRTSRSSR